MFSFLTGTNTTEALKHIRDSIEAVRRNESVSNYAFSTHEQEVIFNDIIAKCINFKEETQELERNLEEVNSRLEIKTMTLTKTETLNASITLRHKDMKTKLVEVEGELIKAQNKVRKYETENKTLSSECDFVKLRYHTLLNKYNYVRKYERESQKLKRDLDTAAEVRDDLQNDVTILENGVKELETENEMLTRKCNSIKTFRKENQKIKRKMKESEATVLQLRNDVAILQEDIEECEAEKQKLVLNCKNMKKLENENKTMKEKLRATEKAFANLQNELIHVEGEMKQVSEERNALLGELDVVTNREKLKDESIRSLKELSQKRNLKKFNKTERTTREQVEKPQRKYQRVVEENKKLENDVDWYCDVIEETDQTVNHLNSNLNPHREQILKQKKSIKHLRPTNKEGNLRSSFPTKRHRYL